VGLHQSIARPIGYRCLASEAPDAIERLLRNYLDESLVGENLRGYFSRRSDAEIREVLAGEFVPAALRDVPLGRVPQGIEG
jgi:sulfite reductase (ferredoxin)